MKSYDPLLEGLVSDVDPTFNEESFKRLVMACLDADPEEDPVYQRVARIYGEKVAKSLSMWLQVEGGDLKNGTKFNNISTQQVFDLLQSGDTSKTLKVLNRTLGGGSSGVAVKMKNGLVIKKLFSDFKHQENANFYEYCLKHKPKVLLKVLKIGKDYVVSEEVKSSTEKCRDYSSAIKDAAFDYRRAEKRKGNKVDPYKDGEGFAPYIDDEEIREWVLEVNHHFKKIGCDFSDIKAANLGEDSNGNILYIDP